jgi:hypothetical protein
MKESHFTVWSWYTHRWSNMLVPYSLDTGNENIATWDWDCVDTREGRGGGRRQLGCRASLGGCPASEYGTYKTVEARFWPWPSGSNRQKVSVCPLLARKRKAYIYVCEHKRIYTYIHIYIYTYIKKCMYAYKYINMYIHTCIHLHVRP